MSSATSTDHQGLHPWQFFLLAGMLSATAVVLVATGQPPASIIVLSVTVVAASFVALGAYHALVPLVRPERAAAPVLIVGRTRAALEREKTLVLRAIKELEFDFAMGKVARADFEELSAKLRLRAIGLMRQLDTSGGYREAIEREVQRRAGALPLDARAHGADAAPSGASPTTTAVALRPCTCGTVNDPDARFCKSCGAAIGEA